MRRAPLAPLLMLPLAALVIGCGSGAGEPGSKQRFISDGDKICDDLGPRGARLAESTVGSPDDALKAASEFRALTRDFSDGLAKLDLPAGADGAAAKEIVDLAGRVTSRARAQKVVAQRLVAAVDDGEVRAVNRLAPRFDAAGEASRRAALRLDRLMREYGFENCGRTS